LKAISVSDLGHMSSSNPAVVTGQGQRKESAFSASILLTDRRQQTVKFRRSTARPEVTTKHMEEEMNLYGLKQLIESARTVRKNTILIAEDIPEKDYGYRPTPESRSVAETLVHIALLPRGARLLHGKVSLEGFDFGELIKKSEIEEKRPRSKKDIVELLRTEGEDWYQWLESLPEASLTEEVRMTGGAATTRFEMLIGTKEHEMHHRAQLTVIERLLGIVPHLTRSRQATAAASAKDA
jgi:uncharacterized damage-inducible protein DinB